jgi:hypothetical protein
MSSQLNLGTNGSYGLSEPTQLSSSHNETVLRAFWYSGNDAAVMMNHRSVFRTVVGVVSYVSPTGAFATVDKVHVPIAHVMKVSPADDIDRKNYKDRKKQVAKAEKNLKKSARAS